MAVGTSGRIIIDTDPEIKKLVYQALKIKGMTMKEWFEVKAKEEFPGAFKPSEKKR
jgi:hypothetical protein